MSTRSWYRWEHTVWLSSETRHGLSAAERGIYRDALDLCYAEGSIPADPEVLRSLLAVLPHDFEASWPKVSKHFHPAPDKPGRLVNAKAAAMLAEAAEYSQKQAEHGRRGGRPKGSKRHRKGYPSASLSEPQRVLKAQHSISSKEEIPTITAVRS